MGSIWDLYPIYWYLILVPAIIAMKRHLLVNLGGGIKKGDHYVYVLLILLTVLLPHFLYGITCLCKVFKAIYGECQVAVFL